MQTEPQPPSSWLPSNPHHQRFDNQSYRDTRRQITIPGKFQTYCSAGKPIISLAKGEVNNLVDDINAGVTGESDNLDEFVK